MAVDARSSGALVDQLTRGASFSAEIPLGLRFVIHSRLFTDEEVVDLEPVEDAVT